jgi:hypothetical protein
VVLEPPRRSQASRARADDDDIQHNSSCAY